MNKRIVALIVAAGSSSRYGKQKLLEDLNGKAVIERTIEAFEKNKLVSEIYIATSENIFNEIENISANFSKVKSILLGGSTRQESVYKGLLAIEDADFVAIHDGARPLVSDELITSVIDAAIECSAAACGVSVKDTIKTIEDGKIVGTVDRSKLVQIQTPQAFEFIEILELHKKYSTDSYTDDTLLFEKAGKKVAIVKGCYKNIKITTAEDIDVARFLGVRAKDN